MARYIGPTTRISRRFNQPIFGATKAFEKRQAGLEKEFGETDIYLLDKVFYAIGASSEDRGLQ
jgi:hypothetical protein